MAIEKINWTFQNGVTPLDDVHFNEMLTKLNSVIDFANASEQMETETTAILARYTKSLSNAQRQAFNTFIKGMKTSGLYDKMGVLVLPFLASNLDEASQNALSGESIFATNQSSIRFANNGLSPIVGESVATLTTECMYVENEYGLTSSNLNYHLSGYNNNERTIFSQDEMVSNNGRGLYSFGKQPEGASGLSFGVKYRNASGLTSLTTFFDDKAVARKHFLASFNDSGASISYNGIYKSNNTPIGGSGWLDNNFKFGRYFTGGSDASIYLDPSTTTGQGATTTCNYNFMSFGKALTETESTTFNTLVETLMESFV